MPFTWDDDRRAYQREWVKAKRTKQRKRANMTLGELLAQGRKLAADAGLPRAEAKPKSEAETAAHPQVPRRHDPGAGR